MKILIVDDEHAVSVALNYILEGRYFEDEIVYFDNSVKLLEQLSDMDLSEIDAVFLDHYINRVGTKNGQGDDIFRALVEKDPTLEEKIFSTSSDPKNVDYIEGSKKIGKPHNYDLASEFGKESYLRRYAEQIKDYLERCNLPTEQSEIRMN